MLGSACKEQDHWVLSFALDALTCRWKKMAGRQVSLMLSLKQASPV